SVLAGLLATGCRVLDGGIASTPTCGVLVQELHAAGGLQITASHNPIEWNGLKPFSAAGSVFDQVLGEKLLDILNRRAFPLVDWRGLGQVETLHDPGDLHLKRVLSLVDVGTVRKRKTQV